MKLSIVTTLYNSARHIEEFYARSTAVALQLVDSDYEIVMVNDGSPDQSLNVAVSLSNKDIHVKVVDLSRNFGHHKALMAGLMHSKGDTVFLIDSDLEEEPEWLSIFSEKMRYHQKQNTYNGCDVVYGVQKQRKGRWIDKIGGRLFYVIFNIMSGFALQGNLVTARLMTRRYVDALLQHHEREIVISGLWHITGFVQHAVQVEKLDLDETTYSFLKKLAMVVNAISSFSNAPLFYVFYTGVFMSFLSMCFIIYIFYRWMFMATPLAGWASTIVSIWFMGGVIISAIGIIGIYISKIFSEVKQRPYVIVRKIYGKNI